jgi:hypothetical protein
LKSKRVQAWNLLEVVVVQLRRSIKLTVGVVILIMQGEVQVMARAGCYSAIQSLKHSVHRKPTHTDTYMQFLTIIQRVVLPLYLLCGISSPRPPNYNTSTSAV